MSQSFRNVVSTIAAFEGFAYMLCDLGSEIEPLQELRKKIKPATRTTLSLFPGHLTINEYKNLENLIKTHATKFAGEDGRMNVVGYLAFSMIGLDSVLQTLKSVKPKNRNPKKIRCFEFLLGLAQELLSLFDPKLDQIFSYEQAQKARQCWEDIFNK